MNLLRDRIPFDCALPIAALTALILLIVASTLGGCNQEDSAKIAQIERGMTLINQGNPLDIYATKNGGYFLLLHHYETLPLMVGVTEIRTPNQPSGEQGWFITAGGIPFTAKRKLAIMVKERIPYGKKEWLRIMTQCGVKLPPTTD